LADADKPIKPENDEKLAFAAKRYLKDKANWTRNDNYKSIWNGVTSGDIQKVIDEDG